jgi:hypothetical protein
MNIKWPEEIMVMDIIRICALSKTQVDLCKGKVWNVGHSILPVSVISEEKDRIDKIEWHIIKRGFDDAW